MNTSSKTILVTGGGSGIGLAIAKLFSEKGNKVIIAGRNEEKLKAAVSDLNDVDYLVADVSNEKDVEDLAALISSKYGKLDILVNNAAVTNVYKLSAEAGIFEKAKAEIATNYLGVINLTEKLLPVLEQQSEAAVVNINAILGYTPSAYMPTHSASKAALRSFSQVLRFTLDSAGSKVKIFEVYPPLVKTEFSAAIGSAKTGIPAEEVAEALLTGLTENTYEIRIGQTDQFYKGFFAGSENAVVALNTPKG